MSTWFMNVLKDGLWYRSSLIDCCKNGSFNVIFIDYGNTQECQKEDLRQLPLAHMKVPRQTLYSVQPDFHSKYDENMPLAVKWENDRHQLYCYKDDMWKRF